MKSSVIALYFLLSSFGLSDYSYNQIIHSSGYYYQLNSTPELFLVINELKITIKIEEEGFNFNAKRIETKCMFLVKDRYTDMEYNELLRSMKEEIKYQANYNAFKRVKGIFFEKIYAGKDYFKLVIVYD